MRWLLLCVSLFTSFGLLVVAQAQPPVEKPAEPTYQVRLRFKIEADLQQRYAHYKQMLAGLEAVGFKAAPGRPREELYGDSLSGTIPATGIKALRLDRFVRTAILVPTGFQLPADIEKTVLVRLQLALTGPDRQQELSVRAREQLKPLGFIENTGFDTMRHTSLLGRLPVAALDTLLKDSMETAIPASYKTSTTVQSKSPLIRLAIVIAEPSPPTPDVAMPVAAPPGKEYLDKISPDLKAYLAKIAEADLDKLMRVELVLNGTYLSESLRNELRHSEALFITEGSFGPIVSGLLSASRLTVLAQHRGISTVRLPQGVRPLPSNAATAIEFIPLGRELWPSPNITQVAYSEPKPARRLVIVGDDFRGYETLIGKGLPKKTTLIDTTIELTSEFKPAPLAAGQGLGQSAVAAQAFLRQEPHDEVILVRIDSTTPFQLQQVGEAVQGRPWLTPSLLARKDEYADERTRIEAERLTLRVERQRIQADYTLDEGAEAKRQEYRKKQAVLDAREKAHFDRGIRFEKFIESINTLRDATTVLVGLQWIDGYADMPGSPPHVRFLTKEVLGSARWFQAVELRPGQVWTGLFRDYDNDHVMEFTTRDVMRPDLAFLSWQQADKRAKQELLPENAVVEVTLNWFEVHAVAAEGDDLYRKPLAQFSLNVLKQRDPSGKVLPPDVFEVVARTQAVPDRVENTARGSHYQAIVRFTVPAGGGRYALQLAGTAPRHTGDALAGERAEIHPKITLAVVDPEHRAAGRVVYESLATPE